MIKSFAKALERVVGRKGESAHISKNSVREFEGGGSGGVIFCLSARLLQSEVHHGRRSEMYDPTILKLEHYPSKDTETLQSKLGNKT